VQHILCLDNFWETWILLGLNTNTFDDFDNFFARKYSTLEGYLRSRMQKWVGLVGAGLRAAKDM